MWLKLPCATARRNSAGTMTDSSGTNCAMSGISLVSQLRVNCEAVSVSSVGFALHSSNRSRTNGNWTALHRTCSCCARIELCFHYILFTQLRFSTYYRSDVSVYIQPSRSSLADKLTGGEYSGTCTLVCCSRS